MRAWGVAFFLLGSLLVGSRAVTGDEPGLTTTTPEGGTVRQQGNRLDLYDAKSNRIGYGYVRPDGSVDLYNQDGTRRATIQRGIGGQPGRVSVPRGKK